MSKINISRDQTGDPVDDSPTTVVLFDGVCVLCNRSVRWLIDRDRDRTLRFYPLASEAGRAVLERAGLDPHRSDSVVACRAGDASTGSDAALRLLRSLGLPWPWFAVCLGLVPRRLRDPAYRFVAARRYRWFGTLDACSVPTPDEREQFPDDTNAALALLLAGFIPSTASPTPRR